MPTRLSEDNVALLLGMYALCPIPGQNSVSVDEAKRAARLAGVTLDPDKCPFVGLECVLLVRCNGKDGEDGPLTFSLTRMGCLVAGMLMAQRRDT